MMMIMILRKVIRDHLAIQSKNRMNIGRTIAGSRLASPLHLFGVIYQHRCLILPQLNRAILHLFKTKTGRRFGAGAFNWLQQQYDEDHQKAAENANLHLIVKVVVHVSPATCNWSSTSSNLSTNACEQKLRRPPVIVRY